MPAELHLLSPRGFVASGIYAGIKTRQAPDVGLLLATTSPATAAAVFTTNKVVAAPVTIGSEHVKSGRLRGVVVNSGNANACTGKQGERDAKRMCELAAAVAKDRARANQILPSSTGIIGHALPMRKIERGIIEAGLQLGDSAEHARTFADAIMTTDTRRKTAAARVKIGGATVTIAGVCKGAGMIGPRMSATPHATMLAYLTTDAQVAAPVLRRLLQEAADASFNAVTIDDHMSTNDTAVLLASGQSDGKVTAGKSLNAFAAALDEVCQSLAYQIAADGEGATKVVTVTVRQAKNVADARAMARAIANSPLVKCAMNGNDPNWGRIVSAAGLAGGAAFDPDKATLTLQGTVVFRNGQPVAFDAGAVSDRLDADEVKVDLACRLGKSEATMWTCDLSKDYVTINADYHT
ncbi:MAG TPA: bifunctional glutamate N-acetyltransferase/amino-acid acetyltransferase ArgJ [Tepidisphaeraceae bacterium]